MFIAVSVKYNNLYSCIVFLFISSNPLNKQHMTLTVGWIGLWMVAGFALDNL